MKFRINNDNWQIKETDKDTMRDLWNKITGEDTCVFGLTIKTSQIIFINKNICEEQKIKTLKHELAHCYIWEYGFYYVEADEETICEIVAKSNDFINRVVEKYRKETKKEEIQMTSKQALELAELNNKYTTQLYALYKMKKLKEEVRNNVNTKRP
jgi:Zn-dependent peptidase ImmA (M78 family)